MVFDKERRAYTPVYCMDDVLASTLVILLCKKTRKENIKNIAIFEDTSS